MTGSATPGHLTSSKVGGHFGAKGSSLNDRGAGEAIKALQLRVGKIPQRYLEPPQAYRELQAKQNKTKQNLRPTTHMKSERHMKR